MGSGTLVLSSTNTFSGGFVLVTGTLALGNPGALGTGLFSFSGGTLRADSSALTLTNAISLGNSVIIGGALGVTLEGSITLTGNRSINAANTAVTTLTGVIGESGGSWRLSTGATGTLRLLGNNSFSGGFTLSYGTVAVGNSGALGTGTANFNGGLIRADGNSM